MKHPKWAARSFALAAALDDQLKAQAAAALAGVG